MRSKDYNLLADAIGHALASPNGDTVDNVINEIEDALHHDSTRFRVEVFRRAIGRSRAYAEEEWRKRRDPKAQEETEGGEQ
jgi:hypothetical protein